MIFLDDLILLNQDPKRTPEGPEVDVLPSDVFGIYHKLEENGDNSNTGDRISRVQRGFNKDGNITSSGQSEKGHSRLQ